MNRRTACARLLSLTAMGVAGLTSLVSAKSSPAAGQQLDTAPERAAPARGTQARSPGDAQRVHEQADAQVLAQTELLGRPTDRSIDISILSAVAADAFVEWRAVKGGPATQSQPLTLRGQEVAELSLTGLAPDREYAYRLHVREHGQATYRALAERSFHTQRSANSAFTFCVQGDSHPERQGIMFDPMLYRETLDRVASAKPDFYMLMGDDFSLTPLMRRGQLTQAAVDQIYVRQRGFLSTVGASAPLFLVNGNHEQAAQPHLDGTPENPAVFAGRARARYFPLPIPDDFYTGDPEVVDHVGYLRDYYAWTWGDALFVVIDPYWHSSLLVDPPPGGRPQRDLWDVTLGEAQYRWLETTLQSSSAQYKFVFCHHVHGTSRGGVEQADLYEWGGRDPRGQRTFATMRPGWKRTLHQLMVETGVRIFFQGHDHLYARQEKDGLIYQTVPCPADPTYQAFNKDAYVQGETLPNSGYLRVSVNPDRVLVDYVGTALPADSARMSDQVLKSYQLEPISAPRWA